MTEQRVIDRLPAVYNKFLPKFFERTIPRESMATCADCAMCPDQENSFPDIISFNKATKCCTHYPNLPNYLVGAILSSTDPAYEEGRDRILKKISSRVAVTPQGLLRSPSYTLVIKNAPDAFGRSKSLLCPYFHGDEGKCTIWAFINANCNTWFCKFSTGEDGRSFWKALKEYLGEVQMMLTYYTQHKLGMDPDKIILPETTSQSITPADLDNEAPDEKSFRGLWGDWAPRVEEFYKEAYKLVESLSRPEFENITGISQKILLKNLENKQRQHVKPDLPPILTRNPNLIVKKTGDDSYTLVSYSKTDPIQISKKVYDMLDFFDGTATNTKVQRIIEQETGLKLKKNLLLSLYQLRILVKSESIE